MADLADGTLDYMILDGTFAVGQAKAGRIRVLAATSAGRITALPDVPTMQEAGVKDYVFSPWWGAYLPAGTPQPIVERISKALEAALATPDVREKLDIAGCEPKSAPLAQFGDIIKSDVALWAKVVKEAGITAD